VTTASIINSTETGRAQGWLSLTDFVLVVCREATEGQGSEDSYTGHVLSLFPMIGAPTGILHT
jgi:hypothetical protein